MIIYDNKRMDNLLAEALRRRETPDAALMQRVKSLQAERRYGAKPNVVKRSFRTVVICAVMFALATGTVFAAWNLLNPGEVAEKFGDASLSAAFKSETAVNINKTVTSGDFIFTLLAVVTGKDITDMPYYKEGVLAERTYAVLAIRNADGSPMQNSGDGADTNEQTVFFASPFVKGLDPARVNAFFLNGGYFEVVSDGVLYRITECDNVEVFADRGLYFAINTGRFYDANAFLYDEQTGGIAADPDFDGASVVFDLPINKALADPETAAGYLDEIDAFWNGSDNDSEDETGGGDAPPTIWNDVDWDKAVPLLSTEKELTVDADGMIRYSYDFEYGGGEVTARYSDIFTDEKTTQAVNGFAASDDDVYAIRFSREGNDGMLTAVVVIPVQ